MALPTIPTEELGKRLIDGQDINAIVAILAAMTGANGSPNPTFPFLVSTADNLVATAGGGQANALPLTASLNRLATVATAGDSVKLPKSAAGLEVTIVNDGANACQVFSNDIAAINGAAAGTGFSLAAGKVATFFCTTAGLWRSQVGA